MAPTCKQLIVIFGPSGTGKSTLVKRLFKDYPGVFGFSVSHTTRQPRSGEVDGKEYHFVSRSQLMAEVQEGKFIEYAEFSGNIYGTSQQAVEDVLKTGKMCVLDIDVQGVAAIKASTLHSQALYIFIRPPSVEALEARLRQRGTETEESLAKRLAAAQREIEYGEAGGSEHNVVINDDLDTAYNELREIVAAHIPPCAA